MEIRLPERAVSKKVTFDENELGEHDKERGTRMTIDEPETPYIRSPMVSSDDEAESKFSGALNQTAPKVCTKLQTFFHINSQTVMIEPEDHAVVEHNEEHRRQFLERRKKHYKSEKAFRQDSSSSE